MNIMCGDKVLIYVGPRLSALAWYNEGIPWYHWRTWRVVERRSHSIIIWRMFRRVQVDLRNTTSGFPVNLGKEGSYPVANVRNIDGTWPGTRLDGATPSGLMRCKF